MALTISNNKSFLPADVCWANPSGLPCCKQIELKAEDKKKLREELKDLEAVLIYEDIYENEFTEERKFTWFENS